MTNQQEIKSNKPNDGGVSKIKTFRAWALAWELGYTIAVPIVVLALLGKFADKAWGTSPWLLLFGIIVSITFSSWLIYKKIKEIV